ncbi:hypothetical protein AVEN_238509-1 [Araneus ventricosus]|uniref:Uncharacterized protein n=1 Tax=Araneus ventricosus TaxID=182803 RepID=A0A4Y2LS70_ARAVE|nr:hypothetical protein AVEN_238509-1 [Araneus ventricosus]
MCLNIVRSETISETSQAGYSRSDRSTPFGARLTRHFQSSAYQFRWVIHGNSMQITQTVTSAFQGYCVDPSSRFRNGTTRPAFPRELHPLPHFVVFAFVRKSRSPLTHDCISVLWPSVPNEKWNRMKIQTFRPPHAHSHNAAILVTRRYAVLNLLQRENSVLNGY